MSDENNTQDNKKENDELDLALTKEEEEELKRKIEEMRKRDPFIYR